MYFKNSITLFTAAVLCLPIAALAQDVPAGASAIKASAGASSKDGDLRIIVLQGEGSVNNIQTHSGTPPVVEVRDRNDQPLDGATVEFELPRMGAGGSFPANQLTFTGRTNRQGQVGIATF